MAALACVYLTAHGKWTFTPWLQERAQIGLRLTIHAAGEDPAKGAIFEVPTSNGDIVQDIGVHAGTNGTLQRAWSARLGPAGSTENADAAWQTDLAEDFRTYLVAIQSYFTTGFRWTHVKIAGQTATGSAPWGSGTYTFTAPVIGTAAFPTPVPPEVALAVSLRAPIAGRRGRGRMYLPAISSGQIANDGTVEAALRTAVNTATKAFIENLEDSPGAEDYGPIVSVMSAGSTHAVRPSEVRVGNHWDAQRRRQDQADEVYSTLAL